MDGVKQDDWTANQSLDNPRRSMLPTAVLFGDGDQDERRKMWVNSIQIRTEKLSDVELESLGGPTVDGIPIVLSVTVALPPVLESSLNPDGTVTLSWATEGGFILESADDLTDPNWTAVPGAQQDRVLARTA